MQLVAERRHRRTHGPVSPQWLDQGMAWAASRVRGLLGLIGFVIRICWGGNSRGLPILALRDPETYPDEGR